MPRHIEFEFDREKAIEIVVYIANRIGDPSFFSIGKILYYADKISLQRYGRFICGDTYYAMKDGPVPSNVYEIMKDAKGHEENYSSEFEVIDYYIVPRRHPNLDEFSESDLICLNEAIAALGNASYPERRNNGHDAAWSKVWNSRQENAKRKKLPIETIAEMFEDGKELIDFLHERHRD